MTAWNRQVRPRPLWTTKMFLYLALPFVLVHPPLFGWIYPEHHDITLRAIQKLNPHRKGVLDSLWAVARTGHESRLSMRPADSTAGVASPKIDYAAWPAIAGDHSCSAANMLQNILETDWILKVSRIGEGLRTDLFKAGLERHQRSNVLRSSDLELLRADPAYASRAGANNVHFLLPRPSTETDRQTYVEISLAAGSELNALGVYTWYHVSALQKGHRISQGNLSVEERASLARAALADEAFALHFLQDAFAAGHVAGTRGDASQRKGTHDYYNEHGLEVRTWEGKSMVLKGDAWMGPGDGERAAAAILASLNQFLDASEGKVASTAFRSRQDVPLTPDTLNACTLEVMPGRELEARIGPLMEEIVDKTPVPGLAEGEGELPRFRSELGPFIGFTPSARVSMLGGAFGSAQTNKGAMAGLEVAVRVGVGLEGVMNESGDGLAFFDIGYRLDAASSTSIVNQEDVELFGNIFAAIPSRKALTARLRVPFWLIPMDMLLAAPFLLPTSPETFAQMGAIASNGGLLPWQAGIATAVGRFQLMLGREIGVAFYGYTSHEDRFLLPVYDPAPERLVLVELRSIQLDFPFLEYRPFRSFSTDQSSGLVLQFYGSVDIPTTIVQKWPEDEPDPELRSVWQIGVRVAFNWRSYW